MSSDCARGLCLVAGSCAAPCQEDKDCSLNERCTSGFVRHDSGPWRAAVCVSRANLDSDVKFESIVASDAISVGTSQLRLPGTSDPAVYVIEHVNDHAWPFSSDCRPPLCALSLRTREAQPITLFSRGQDATLDTTSIANWPYAFPLTVYIGNNVDPVYSGSGYDLEVIAEVAGDARITQLSRSAQSQGVLDINLFYAGVTALTSSSGDIPQIVVDALDVVSSIYAQAGITLGDVHQVMIPQTLLESGNTFENADDPRAGFSVLHRGYGVWPELPALFALSAGVPNGGVNLFLVSDIEGMGDGEVQALAGGTPGPMGIQGTGASGIAIAADMLMGDADKLGRTMAHEIAHYLGLFHISEGDGTVLDSLADTPECTLAQDSNNDAQLSLDECIDFGADNLMFWATGAGHALTQDQITILRRALLLR